MPLSKARQKAYMKDYRQRVRYNVIPNEPIPFVPKISPQLLATLQTPVIPNYDPRKHKAGDTVIFNGQVVTIPELDGDGHPIW